MADLPSTRTVVLLALVCLAAAVGVASVITAPERPPLVRAGA